MEKKLQVEVLCTEEIPRLLREESPAVVFDESIRLCDKEHCPKYHAPRRLSNRKFCEQDLGFVFLSHCRLGYPPIAQSPPKCIENQQRYMEIESEEAQEARL
jgi:hypothetical protein